METALENKGFNRKAERSAIQWIHWRGCWTSCPGMCPENDKLDQLLTSAESVMADPRTVEKIKLKLDHTNIDWNTLESGIHFNLEKLPSAVTSNRKIRAGSSFFLRKKM